MPISIMKLLEMSKIYEEKEKVLYAVRYKDGTEDFVEMTWHERTHMPYGTVKSVEGMKWHPLPAGKVLTPYEDMVKKAKKKK